MTARSVGQIGQSHHTFNSISKQHTGHNSKGKPMSKKDLGYQEAMKWVEENPEWKFLWGKLHKNTQHFDTTLADKGYIVVKRKGHSHQVFSLKDRAEVYHSSSGSKVSSWITNKIKADTQEAQQEEVIGKQGEAIETVGDETKKLIKDMLANIEAEKQASATILNRLKAGEPLEVILSDLAADGLIDNVMLANLRSKFAGYERTNQAVDTIQTGINERNNILDALKEEQTAQKAKEGANLQFLSDKDIGVPSISKLFKEIRGMADTAHGVGQTVYDAGSAAIGLGKGVYNAGKSAKDFMGNLSIGDLLRGNTLKKIDEAAADTEPFIKDVYHDTKSMRGKRATWEDIQKQYWENPGLHDYDRLQGHRNKMSNIAASGHYAGSTAFEDAKKDYSRAMKREDLAIMRDMYDAAQRDWEDQARHGKMLEDASTRYQENIVRPSLAQHELWEKSKTANSHNQIAKNRDARDQAEGELKNSILNEERQLSIGDRLAAQESQNLQSSKLLQQQVQQLSSLLNNQAILTGEQQLQLRGIEMNFWQQREQIISMLMQRGDLHEAQEMQMAKTPQAFAEKLVKFLPALSTAAGATIGAVVGGPAGAVQGAQVGASVPWGSWFGRGKQ